MIEKYFAIQYYAQIVGLTIFGLLVLVCVILFVVAVIKNGFRK